MAHVRPVSKKEKFDLEQGTLMLYMHGFFWTMVLYLWQIVFSC